MVGFDDADPDPDGAVVSVPPLVAVNLDDPPPPPPPPVLTPLNKEELNELEFSFAFGSAFC
jgi:hypothetical protein